VDENLKLIKYLARSRWLLAILPRTASPDPGRTYDLDLDLDLLLEPETSLSLTGDLEPPLEL